MRIAPQLLFLFVARAALAASPLEDKVDSQLRAALEQKGPARLVDIDAAVSPELLDRIKSLGGTIYSSFPNHRAIRAEVPLAALEPLAQEPAVRFIRPAVPAATRAVGPVPALSLP